MPYKIMWKYKGKKYQHLIHAGEGDAFATRHEAELYKRMAESSDTYLQAKRNWGKNIKLIIVKF